MLPLVNSFIERVREVVGIGFKGGEQKKMNLSKSQSAREEQLLAVISLQIPQTM